MATIMRWNNVISKCFRKNGSRLTIAALLLVLLTTADNGVAAGSTPNVCQSVDVAMCQDMPYNQTSFPNLVGSEDQREAGVQLHTFAPLIAVQCSAQLQFFLCSVYVPMCTDKIHIPIGPCRPLCESVRRRCEPMLIQFGFPWPLHLNCSKFPPENNAQSMCMRGPPNGGGELDDPLPASDDGTVVAQPAAASRCRQPGLIFVNKTGDCAYLCADPASSGGGHRKALTSSQKSVASALLNGICIAVCLMAVVGSCTSFYRSKHLQFRYPEWIFLFLSLCFTVISVTHLIVQSKNSQVFCTDYGQKRVLVSPGLPHAPCATVAVLLYYASTAARIWWVILCWTWYLSSPRQWNPDAIHLVLNFRFQVLAWGGPMVLVVVALMAQAIDADPLTGVCMVGFQSAINARSATYLLLFVGVREAATLLAGVVPLLLAAVPLLAGRRRPTTDDPTATATAAAQPPPGSLCCLTAVCYLPVSAVLLCCYTYQYAESASSGAAAGSSFFETALLRAVFELVYGVAVGVAWLAWALVPCRFLQSRMLMMPYTPKGGGSSNTYVSSRHQHGQNQNQQQQNSSLLLNNTLTSGGGYQCPS